MVQLVTLKTEVHQTSKSEQLPRVSLRNKRVLRQRSIQTKLADSIVISQPGLMHKNIPDVIVVQSRNKTWAVMIRTLWIRTSCESIRCSSSLVTVRRSRSVLSTTRMTICKSHNM